MVFTVLNWFFQQHGESHCNKMGRIGGDSDLSDNGERFGEALARYIKEQNIPKVIIILSEDCFLIY